MENIILDVKDDMRFIKSSLLVLQNACENIEEVDPLNIATSIGVLIYFIDNKMCYLNNKEGND